MANFEVTAQAPGRPKPPDRLWRLRTAFDAGLENCGGDAADRPFWPDGLAETDGETALVLARDRSGVTKRLRECMVFARRRVERAGFLIILSEC